MEEEEEGTKEKKVTWREAYRIWGKKKALWSYRKNSGRI